MVGNRAPLRRFRIRPTESSALNGLVKSLFLVRRLELYRAPRDRLVAVSYHDIDTFEDTFTSSQGARHDTMAQTYSRIDRGCGTRRSRSAADERRGRCPSPTAGMPRKGRLDT